MLRIFNLSILLGTVFSHPFHISFMQPAPDVCMLLMRFAFAGDYICSDNSGAMSVRM